VDLVEAEDGESVMAYVYTATDHCVTLLFEKPDLDPDQVRDVLLKPRSVH
jgi:hypothetical protein